ncbi:MAG: hypothetical protein AMXMBFR61_16910 [Fimbriimonadales bacterium]
MPCFDRLSMTVFGGALRDAAACFDNLGMASRTPDPHLCEPSGIRSPPCFDRLSMTVFGGALRDAATCFDNLGMASRTPDPHLCEP